MEIRELEDVELKKLSKINKELFEELSQEEIAEITEKLWMVHFGLEEYIVYYDFGTLTDPDSLKWETFNDTNPDDNVDNGHWGTEAIEDLEEIKAKLSDDKVIRLITDVQNEIQLTMDEHSNTHVMQAHALLHDLDYWLFRYPVENFEWAPADWNGIHIYYGGLDEVLRYN